ncbi:putative Serine/threonine-protein kinase receptor [Melia azedarach]|uniref:Serine/threonine-protein kinase receptor n=1 Tax=Melia azedarach TaxID=155640 RepID=A0ACC1YR60_MELAZ|nr:putative Serine/threonine-protein kinase receptor [Melia azedarach]
MENMLFFPIFSSFIFFCSIKFSMAVDTLSPGRFIRDGEKLVSPSRNFELGYFSPGKSKNRYLGIWYKRTPETVVWVANRNSPIVDPHGVLTISKNGNLFLLNETNDIVWSSNISQKIESPVAQLLDTGNLVLMDNFRGTTSESYHWQSFDYPSDTLLAGMKLGWNLKTGLQRHLTSWRSADDPSPGNYTFRYDNLVLPQICLYQGSVKISCGGAWNGGSYGANLQTNFLYERSLVHNEDELYYKFESYNNPVIMIMKLNPVGNVQRLIWKERTMRWEIIYSFPGNFCEHYGKCGDNSVCSMDKTPNCECLEGFKLKSQNNQTWPVTCVRSHSSDCKRRDRFLKLADIKLPDLLAVSLNESMNLKECEAECLKNCSCRAYANFNVTVGGRGCLMWYGDLIDIRKITKPYTGLSVYIRVSASEQEKMKTNQDMLLFDVNMSITTRANEFCNGDRAKKGRSKESWLPLFSFASVSAATGNFCMRNKLGEGGFGPVYKGELLNGQEVAVKRLASQSGQGLEEFKNEMMLIAKLQHRNLVRILGCCIEKSEKILIYEYMPNKSLDFFLFDPTKKGLLGWRARVRIIEGIAQGLLYLHQYSRLRIIHRDLKASNILLDNNMNPKISDFGMARMFGGDELQANTNRIVGTYGYMSPEYALEGIFSIKSDVFSFGILLLETLSSKKNTGFYNTDSLNLLGLAWDLWNEDRAEDLMDAILENEASYLVLKRYINVALLCVQENAEDRPTMSEVVSMLTNELVNLRPPKQPAFSRLRSVKNSVLSTTMLPEACSVNNVTISVIDPR